MKYVQHYAALKIKIIVMFEKDKLHVVFYIDIRNVDTMDVSEYISEIEHNIKKTDDGSVRYYLIPTNKDMERWVEFHWPPYVPEEERKLPDNVEQYIEKNNKNIM